MGLVACGATLKNASDWWYSVGPKLEKLFFGWYHFFKSRAYLSMAVGIYKENKKKNLDNKEEVLLNKISS